MISLLRRRRSIRKFLKKPIDKRSITLLEEAVLRAPSSRDRKPWEFIFVDDPHLLAALSCSKPHGASFLAGAPLGVVVVGDESLCDVWVEDCSIASIILQFAALSIGLGSCWIQIRNRKTSEGSDSEAVIRGLLKIPPHFRVESIIAVGHPAEKKRGTSRKKLDIHKIHRNRYQCQ